MAGFSGKARCVKNDSNGREKICRVGQMLEFKDGCTVWNNGKPSCRYESIDQFNENNGPNLVLELIAEPKQFTKADLKTGMRVKTRDSNMCNVLKDVETELYGHQDILFSSNDMFLAGSKYNSNLNRIEDIPEAREYDIVEIFDKPADSYLLDLSRYGKRLWKRPEPRKMTKLEAEKYISEQLDETVLIEG